MKISLIIQRNSNGREAYETLWRTGNVQKTISYLCPELGELFNGIIENGGADKLYKSIADNLSFAMPDIWIYYYNIPKVSFDTDTKRIIVSDKLFGQCYGNVSRGIAFFVCCVIGIAEAIVNEAKNAPEIDIYDKCSHVIGDAYLSSYVSYYALALCGCKMNFRKLR